MRMDRVRALAVTCAAIAIALALPRGAAGAAASDTLHWSEAPAHGDTLRFAPVDADTDFVGPHHRVRRARQDEWLRAPFGDGLITGPGRWRDRGHTWRANDFIADYNRVDRLRLGLHAEYGARAPRAPRAGARIEYAFGRKRTLYGVELRQPVTANNRFAFGVSFVRRTDHLELQQIEDAENSLALLFGRQDYRDYFEREGAGVYARWRVPDFSTISVHLREDTWRSLATDRRTRSWFHTDRPLRDNPAIDDGDTRTVTLRLEKMLHQSAQTRAGLYHWVELERAGAGLGGDFTYTRALGDWRSVLRLSPATTLALRGVAGSTLAGAAPRQKEFTLGGVDGLRGHAFGAYRGDQIALAQAEYSVGLWPLDGDLIPGGLQAIVFLDTGRAWTNPARRWDPARQRMQADGGFGFATSDDDLRVYFARNLQRPGSDYVVTLRLKRPF